MTNKVLRGPYDPSGHNQPKGANEYDDRDVDELGKRMDGTKMPSMTEQHHQESSDINNIMKKYTETGIVDHVSKYEPVYGDHSGADFHEAMSIVANAQSMFLDLPAQAREKFDNDPAKFLDYVDTIDIDTVDPAELLSLDIIEPRSETWMKAMERGMSQHQREKHQQENPTTTEPELPVEPPAEA